MTRLICEQLGAHLTMGESHADEQPINSNIQDNTQGEEEEETKQRETTTPVTATCKFYMSLELDLESKSKAPNY